MKAENIAYIKETERHIEYSIAYETDRRAISRMNQALAYIHGSLKAAELGDERMAMCNLDKANYWMAQARGMCREDGESEGRKTPKNPSLPHRERCRLMT